MTDQHCGLCGKPFVLACARCNVPLLDHFVSPSFVGTGAPVNPPQRPENCTNCGKAFPWNLAWHHRAATSAKKIPATIWTEFKALSAPHIILIIVFLLVVFGVIRWHDVFEVLKAIAGKKE